MYVILDRALPHIARWAQACAAPHHLRDVGARPAADAKPKKSARTVGDVIGKFHPHGDSACYEAMVLMAQPFSMRYPLVDGQGNWGSPRRSEIVRRDALHRGEADEVRASRCCPSSSRARSSGARTSTARCASRSCCRRACRTSCSTARPGIAVGMATDIPSHNVREVVGACIELLDNPDVTLAQITKHIKGPDFPTDAEIITPLAEIREMYKTGNGSIRQRAKWEIEDGDLVVTALPFQVSGNKVRSRSRADAGEEAADGGRPARRVRSREPDALVIVPRSNRVDPKS